MFEGYIIIFGCLFLSLLANLGVFIGGTIGNIMLEISTFLTFAIFVYINSSVFEKHFWL
ncbi:hypothetical protein [Acetivibrio cellulolyticus]|uniref:hypothetical protein n=1 Tax=Acetivibrio cellulolyticus TaxID=35830 RepID=UPI0001E2C79A|nr:hypothetical protein [Acetivibrio cellulolyticus]